MITLNEQTINKQEQQWEKKKKLIIRKQKIQKEKQKLKPKIFTTTKLLIFFLFLNCTAIELFTGWVTVQSLSNSLIIGQAADFTPLITLIGTIVGEVIGFGVYALKSLKENTAGGIIYEQAIHRHLEEDEDI